MGILDFVKGQFIEVIEWLEDDDDILAWRFPVRGQEIKMGAQLIVREGQAAVFVNEGEIADVFQPGTYTLETQNMPVLTKLKSWKYGFSSPFKAEVYFVSTRRSLDLKWGTQNPIMLRDKDFGVVRLRAFGMFSIKVVDPPRFLREIVGTDGEFTKKEIEGFLRRQLVSSFTVELGKLGVPALDLAANYGAIGEQARQKMIPTFQNYGLSLEQFVIENISLPPELEKALDERSSMGIIGNMGTYRDYQTAKAIGDAARQPGSIAGEAMGIGAGFGLGSMMADAMRPKEPSPQSSPTPQQLLCPKCNEPVIAGKPFCPNCGNRMSAPATSPCAKCGEPVPENARFCPNCGAPQTLSCSNCGASLSANVKFCPECGNKMG